MGLLPAPRPVGVWCRGGTDGSRRATAQGGGVRHRRAVGARRQPAGAPVLRAPRVGADGYRGQLRRLLRSERPRGRVPEGVVMAIDVRPTKPEEYRAASNTVATALMFPPADDESWERSRASWDESSSISAWDGDRCVGHASQFFVDTTVPGGARVLTGAVTRVGVLPTHRRRGVATSLMDALIADAVGRRAVLMSLRASEAVIYGRYGFGMAGEYTEIEIDPRRARPVSGAASGGTFKMLRPDEIDAAVRPIYDAAAHRRPGIVTRPDSWWKRYLGDAVKGSKPSHVVVHVDSNGNPDGFVHYDVA